MTRIAILSDTRCPTLPYGGHGLARVVCDLAVGLTSKGHDITIYAGPDSVAPDGVALATHDDEVKRIDALQPDAADVWLDVSHLHALTRRREFKQAHYIVDLECNHQPVNTVVGGAYMAQSFPGAECVPLGIDVDAIPFNATGGSHLLFAAKVHYLKGPDIASDVAARTKRELHVYGELWANEPPGYRGVIDDNAEFYRVLGGAYAFLAPYRADAGGRVLLEAQAAGTPVLTFADVGCRDHVGHCVGGFVVCNPDEMADAVADVARLKRADARAWVDVHHSLRAMIDGFERVLMRAADGECW
jgi:glycosyltransferase involved in cell wall biosynthesis